MGDERINLMPDDEDEEEDDGGKGGESTSLAVNH